MTIHDKYIDAKLAELDVIQLELDQLPHGDRKAEIGNVVVMIRNALVEMDARLAKGGKIAQTEEFIDSLFRKVKS